MKKILVLMSVGLLTLGTYSFSIAMQYNGWDNDGDGFHDSSNDAVAELADSVEQLSLEAVYAKKSHVATKKNVKLSEVSNDQIVQMDCVLDEIAELGDRNFSIEEIEDTRALLDSKKYNGIDQIEAVYEKKHNTFEAQKQNKALLFAEELQQRCAEHDRIQQNKEKNKVLVFGEELKQRCVEKEAFERKLQESQRLYELRKNAQCASHQDEQSQREWKFQVSDECDAQYKQQVSKRPPVREKMKKILGNGLMPKSLFNRGGYSLNHVESRNFDAERAQDVANFKADRNATKGKIQAALHQVKLRAIPYEASLLKLAYARSTSVDNSFKFLDWQQELAAQYFNTPDGIEAGKIHAFQVGDILALISYSDYLNSYFQSNYVFDRNAWVELLSTLLLTNIRIIQDAHAVVAVETHIDELILGKFPIDTRFAAWKESLNDAVLGGIFSINTDMTYAQGAREGVLAYMSRIWAPRIADAIKNQTLPPFEEVLTHVKEVMNNINPSSMPTPAAVCCLNGNTTWNAAQALEKAFRMFDFTENRAEGLEIALYGIDQCKNWNDFMTRILRVGA